MRWNQIRARQIEETELCEHCNQRFDVSLPDTDEHRYVCAEPDCHAVICWDCKNMDKYGEDRCPEHEHLNEYEEN